MSKKKLGRRFNVGDKVVFTKEAIENGVFHTDLRVGDIAVVTEVMCGELGQYPWTLVVEKLDDSTQHVLSEYNGSVYEWFEHVDDKKKRKKKKQRKYFRMGDFVALKDGKSLETDVVFGDITHSNIGVVVGVGRDGTVEVHFTTAGGYDFDRVRPEALRLATKEERKALRKRKVDKITYDDVEGEVAAKEVEESIPEEYDVKVGDIVEITRYSSGHDVGSLVKVVEGRLLGYGARYNTVRAVGFDGKEWSEDDVKLIYRKENDGDNA